MNDNVKAVIAVVLLGLGAFGLYRFFTSDRSGTEKAFFYDLSEQKLFKASRTSVPPIKGLNDGKEDAVRAIVVSTNSKPADKSSWKIVYLEKYSPELKRQMEQAQATGTSPAMGRGEALGHRFVKRVTDSDWF